MNGLGNAMGCYLIQEPANPMVLRKKWKISTKTGKIAISRKAFKPA